MFTSHDVIWGIALPALIATVAMVLARVSRQNNTRAGSWCAAAGMTIGFIIAFLGIVRRSPLPPHEATDWLCVLGAWCLVLALIDGFVATPALIRIVMTAVTFLTIDWLILRPLGELPEDSPSRLSSPALVGWVVGLAAIAWIWWFRLESLAQGESPTLVMSLMLMLAALVGLGLLLSSSKSLGQFAGAVAVTLAPPFVLSCRYDVRSQVLGLARAFVSFIVSLLVCGHFYATLSRLNGSLFVASGLLITAGSFIPAAKLQGWKRYLVLALLSVGPAVIAVVIAAVEFAESMAESGGY